MLIFFYFCLEIVMKQDDQSTRWRVEGKEQLWTQGGSFSFVFLLLDWGGQEDEEHIKAAFFFILMTRPLRLVGLFHHQEPTFKTQNLIFSHFSFRLFSRWWHFQNTGIFGNESQFPTTNKKWKTIKPRCCLHVGVQLNSIRFYLYRTFYNKTASRCFTES